MADFAPPSFSLGLDFDLDSEPQIAVRQDPVLGKQARPSSSNPSYRLIEDDDDFELSALHRDPQVSEPPRTLKRIRRGPASESSSAAQKRDSVESWNKSFNVDDEIEEFSSQEDRCRANAHSSVQFQSGCSSSKFPLHGHGVLTRQSASQRKVTERKLASNTPASTSLETSSNKLVFPNLTVSPLRRFQLLDSDSDSDSDSDEPSVSDDVDREANKVDSSLKKPQCNPGQYPTISGRKSTKVLPIKSQTEDLWKDFHTEKSFNIPTPALDEVCEEYFRSVKDKNEAPILRRDKCISANKGCNRDCNAINNDDHLCKWGDPIRPAHRYFFHDDPRIQKLIRSRLPYFFPLGVMNNGGNKNPISSVIDYMSQFSHGEGSKQQASGKTNVENNSTRCRKNSKKSNAEELSQGSGSWVHPKSSVGIPKDAGKRRVHAVGQSGGHWYTNPDGKRVYVTKNGQELTGQLAYRHYKKESGAGFKKSKKKTAAKRKPAAKKKTAAKRK